MVVGDRERIIQLAKLPAEKRTDEDIRAVLPWLRKASPLLKDIDKSVLQTILKHCSYRSVTTDDVIIRQGDIGDRLFIILSGKVSIYVSGERLKDTALFEEQSLDTAAANQNAENEEQPLLTQEAVEAIVVAGLNEVMVKDEERAGNESPVSLESRPSTHFGNRSEVTSAMSVASVADDPWLEELPKVGDRKSLGSLVIRFGQGKSFGELALIQADCVRKASVVADETCELLILSRAVYNGTLKVFQQREYAMKHRFVENSPLFRGWGRRAKHHVTMSLTREVYPYDSIVWQQGEPHTGIHFVIKGRLLVSTSPAMHPSQYPHLEPYMVEPALQELRLLMGDHWGREPPVCIEEQPRQALVHMRRTRGYRAVEQYLHDKTVPLAVISDGGTLGDVEIIAALSTNLGTAWCAAHTETLFLSVKNFERLGLRRSHETMSLMRQVVDGKMRARIHTAADNGNEIPYLKGILAYVNAVPRQPPKPLPPLAGTKTLPDDDVLFQHLVDTFARSKAELIDPSVRGGIYFREMMRERARHRQKVKELKEQRAAIAANKGRIELAKEREAKQQQNQRRAARALIIKPKSDRARTIKELSRAITQFKATQERQQELDVIRRYREREENNLRRSYAIAMETRAREEAAAAAAAEEEMRRMREAEMLAEEERLMTSSRHVSHDASTNAATPAAALKAAPMQMSRSVLQRMSASKRNQEADLVMQSVDLELESRSYQQPPLHPTTDVTATTATTSITSGATKDLKTAQESSVKMPPLLESTHIDSSLHAATDHNGPGFDKHSRIDLGNDKDSPLNSPPNTQRLPRVGNRSQRLQLETSLYRDWETSDRVLSRLEERIQQFASSLAASQQPPPQQAPQHAQHSKQHKQQQQQQQQREQRYVHKLKRFERSEDNQQQPLHGGRILIQKKQCVLQHPSHHGNEHLHDNQSISSSVGTWHHPHDRMHVVDSIPGYAMRRHERMLQRLVHVSSSSDGVLALPSNAT